MCIGTIFILFLFFQFQKVIYKSLLKMLFFQLILIWNEDVIVVRFTFSKLKWKKTWNLIKINKNIGLAIQKAIFILNLENQSLNGSKRKIKFDKIETSLQRDFV